MFREALEEQGQQVFEHDNGFLVYRESKDSKGLSFYLIHSLYLKKEFRNNTGLSELMRVFEASSKSLEINHLVWPTMLSDQSKESTLLTQLMLGFKIASADAQKIVAVKQLT